MKKVEALSLEELQKERKIEWIDMGIEGLTDFIPGLPKGDAILVRGEPGTGKTICCPLERLSLPDYERASSHSGPFHWCIIR